MASGAWKQPVGVHAGKNGGVRYTVRDTVKAAEILTSQWPKRADERGRKYFAACRACMSVLEGKADPEKARLAFIAAAKEADILAE